MRRASRLRGHSASPNMLTRSRWAATSGSSQGFDGAAPEAETLTGTWQADAPLMHAQNLGAKDDLKLVDEPLGVGRSQELAHLDGSRLVVLLALPAKSCACKPSRGGRKRASRDPAEHRRERRVKLVVMNPPRHAEHVNDVFRSSACGAQSCEGGLMQPGEGPIPILTRRAGSL